MLDSKIDLHIKKISERLIALNRVRHSILDTINTLQTTKDFLINIKTLIITNIPEK